MTRDFDRGLWLLLALSAATFYVVWFPQPVHTLRLECVAGGELRRFKRLCSEPIGSLEFH
jgi:hypothetical protein